MSTPTVAISGKLLSSSAEGYDEEATAEADPSHTNEEAVFADGSRLWWNAALNAWETGPASDQMRIT